MPCTTGGNQQALECLQVTTLDFLKRKSNFFKAGDAKRRMLEAYKEVAGEAEGMRAGFFGSGTARSAVKQAPTSAATTAAPVAHSAQAPPVQPPLEVGK